MNERLDALPEKPTQRLHVLYDGSCIICGERIEALDGTGEYQNSGGWPYVVLEPGELVYWRLYTGHPAEAFDETFTPVEAEAHATAVQRGGPGSFAILDYANLTVQPAPKES